MSNNHLPVAGNSLQAVPAPDEEIRELLEEDLGGFTPTPIQVKIEHRMRFFVFPDGQTEEELTGVILIAKKVRAYWEQGDRVPKCISFDGNTGKTSEGEERNCASCPYDKWGSGGEQRKACKEQRRVLFLVDGWTIPVLINVPPSSLKRFDSFVSALYAKKIPLCGVIVSLRLDEAMKGEYNFSRLSIKVKRQVTPEEFTVIKRMRDYYKPTLTQNVTIEEFEDTPKEETLFKQDSSNDLSSIPF